jgi:hypothetical protein
MSTIVPMNTNQERFNELLSVLAKQAAAIQRVRELAEKFEREDGPGMDYRTAANRVRGALNGESND